MSGLPATATRAQQIEAGVCSLSRAGAHGLHAPLSLASTGKTGAAPPTPSPPPPWLHSRRQTYTAPRGKAAPAAPAAQAAPQQLRHLQQLPLHRWHPLHPQLRLPQPRSSTGS